MDSVLSSSSYEALKKCEAFFDALGLRMTAGAELEWYSLVPTDNPSILTPDQVEAELKAIGSDVLLNSYTFRPERPDSKDPDLYRNIHNLLLFRIEQRLKEEGIAFFNTTKESGTVGSADSSVTMVEPDGRKWKATGQKLEVGLGATSPTQQAQLLEKLHDVVREENEKLGLIADFRSKPPYTYKDMENGELLDNPLPGTSQHVHFGLVEKDTGKNALLTADSTTNYLASSFNERMRDLLQRGGQLLANPVLDDYPRFQHISNSSVGVPLILGNAFKPRVFKGKLVPSKGESIYKTIDKATCALREIAMGGPNIQNYHKELRIMGGNTPAPSAVLLPAIALADTVACAIGRPPGWGTHSHVGDESHLDSMIPGISDTDREVLQQRISEPGHVAELNLQELKTTWADAAKTLAYDSPLFHYAPQVYKVLQQLSGKSLAA